MFVGTTTAGGITTTVGTETTTETTTGPSVSTETTTPSNTTLLYINIRFLFSEDTKFLTKNGTIILNHQVFVCKLDIQLHLP